MKIKYVTWKVGEWDATPGIDDAAEIGNICTGELEVDAVTPKQCFEALIKHTNLDCDWQDIEHEIYYSHNKKSNTIVAHSLDRYEHWVFVKL